MNRITYLEEIPSSVEEYEDRFGEFELDDLPYQFDIDNRAERPSFYSREFGDLLARCLAEDRKVTVRDYVDTFYLGADGVYSHIGIKARDYDEFVDKVSNTEVFF